jgi:L-seryl-tRNA(Ser) seleniumtransferase/D-glucosaminate-6-phosphate ammonia-lyase
VPGTVADVAFGEPLAIALEAEAACAWHDWAGALAVAAAACLAAGGSSCRIVLQRGHVVDIGDGSIPGLLRLAGAEPAEVGAVNLCRLADLRAALTATGAAAGLFVLGPAAPAGLVDLPGFVWCCREAGRTALVAIQGKEASPGAALDAGADLVVADAAEALGGPPLGLVAGRASLVRACLAQRDGLGRVALPRAAEVEALRSALAARGRSHP